MAAARLIFRVPVQKKIGSLEVTAFVSETHTRTNSATAYPVEVGADISDHIQDLPQEFNVTGIVEPVGDGANVPAAFVELENIMATKELITVVSGLKVYENMYISSLSVPRNARNGGSLSFSASMRELRIVSSQAVEIPKAQISDADDETNKQAQATQDIGKVTSGQTQATAEASNFLDQVDAQIDDIFGSL